MIVHLPLLLLAALLLWFPRRWMRLGTVLRQRRSHSRPPSSSEPWLAREPGDPRVDLRVEFGKFRNYLDLLRAGAGSLALAGGMGIPASLAAGAGAPQGEVRQVLLIRLLIMFVGMMVQMIRWERSRLSLYPPIFYLAGLSVGLCDIRGAAFAFALVWACSPLFGSGQSFLTVYAIFLAGFGHFFAGGGDLSAAFAGVLAFLPVLVSLLANRPLTVFTRTSTRSAGNG